MGRLARRFKTHPRDLWSDEISDIDTASTINGESTGIPTPTSPVPPPSRTPSPSPRNWQPSLRETQEFLKHLAAMGLKSPLGNLPAGSGPGASQALKATLQLGPTSPLAFRCEKPPVKYAHLVCDGGWPEDSPQLHCPYRPLVCYGEVRHHSYHGGDFLGIVVIRSNITTLQFGETLQVECRIGFEDDLASPILCWLQCQIYLQTFFQNRLSSESDDVRLNCVRWKNTMSPDTPVEMQTRLFVKGESLEPLRKVALHGAPKTGQQRNEYQPEVFGRNVKVCGKEKDFQHLTWSVRHRFANVQKSLRRELAELGESRMDLVPGDVMLCRTTRQVLGDASALDGFHVVVMPHVDLLGSLPLSAAGLVLVMKLKPKEEGRGTIFKVSKTTLHPDPTVDLCAMYQPSVEVLQDQNWCKAKLCLQRGGISAGTRVAMCGKGQGAHEVRVDPGNVRIRFELPANIREGINNADAFTVAQTSAHSA